MLEDANGRPILKDGRCQWVVQANLTYEVGAVGSGVMIVVPTGTITDFASIPRLFWRLYPPDGPWLKAAVVHDHLYKSRGNVLRVGHPCKFTRAESDDILREAMAVLGVGKVERLAIYSGVRVGGWKGWGS